MTFARTCHPLSAAMEESKGFLDDTSLSKTPRSPLKTSTVLRPNSNRSENLFAKRLATCGIDGSFNPRDEASFQALTEVTNIPNFPLLKQKFKSISEMSLADDANSSLGLLHMDNFSVKETPSVKFQDIEEDNEESDRNSSPDIEYDGTNIPELNLDYDALSAFQYPKTLPSKNTSSKIPKEGEESFFRNFEAIRSDSALYNSTEISLQISNTQASNDESRMTRDSLFENFNPAYDSIFKSLMPNGSVSDDDKVSKLSQVMNACSFMDGNSSKLQTILQNQNLAEQNFLKNLQRLRETSSLKFSPDEISARSTSFRSPSPPNTNDCSEISPSIDEKICTENKNQVKTILDDEGPKEIVLSGSVFVNNAKKESTTVTEETVENQSFDPDSLECSGKANTFMSENDSMFQNITCDQSFGCDLNYKDTSKFISSCGIEQNQFEIPDSDFMTKDEALEIFKKDEEQHKDEHKFENAYNSKESVTSTFSFPSKNNVTPPPWFLELHNDEVNSGHHVSIGTLISARTENLGRLSEDSKRERPFFGTYVSTPVRGLSENSSVLSESVERTLELSNEQGIGSIENSSDFKNTSVDSSTTTKDNEKDSKACECANCLFRQQKLYCPGARPASSCSNSCKNATPFHNILQGPYGCMAHSNPQEQYYQNLNPSCGAMQHLGNFLLGSQFHNPCAPNSLPTQMLSVAIPQSVAQGPLSGFSSAAFSMQGAVPHSYPAAQGQNDLHFPQKICVGDSQSITLTIQNTMHTMQYFYHISYISASINEQPVSIEMAGIHFPSMFPRSMSSTTDIQITLNPKYEGKIVVILQIVACFNPSELTMAAIGNSSLKTKIQYESVRPSVLISSHGKDNLNIGSVIAGSKVLEQISIINKCDAVVPICLSLSNDLKDNCISFRINELKLQTLSTAAQWKVLSPKTILCRLPNSNNEGTASRLEIPIIFEAGNDNCDLNFTLTAALQTATFSEPLGFLRISATVGRAELVLTDKTKNRLLLCSETGSVCNQNVTVKNQCSFPVVYDLMVVGDDSDSFSISPTSLNLQPLQSYALKISFSPTSTLVIKGNLQAAAQPHGKVFSLIELIGTSKSTGAVPRSSRNVPPNVVSKSSSKDTKRISYNSSNIIECNKKYLSWGGVDIGSTETKTFNIKNTSSKSLQVKLFIQEKSQSSFKIMDENKDYTTNFILELMSKEQKSISVAFTPTRIAPSSGFIAIKPIMENYRKAFSMPLAGYGGTGKLKVAEVYEKEGIGYCLDIIVSRERRTVFSNLSVHNIGLRPVFVKVVSSGNSNKEQIVISPSEFILLENDSKTLIVSCTIENFSMINAADFGIITLLYGDEILRQQLRRSATENSTYPRTLCHDVNFDGPFVGEERVPY
ncbi:Centrosomal protein, partial [Araneus ventricosus]